jgi:hypothetical protein
MTALTLFTNADDLVIFADPAFMRLGGYSGNEIFKKPLDQVLGLDKPVIEPMLSALRSVGHLESTPIRVKTFHGYSATVLCSARANFGASRRYLGSDFALDTDGSVSQARPMSAPPPAARSFEHYATSVIQSQQEARSNDTLVAYTLTHLQAVRLNVSRYLGDNVEQRFTNHVKDAAKKSHLLLDLDNSSLSGEAASAQVYFALIQTGRDFAVRMLGDHLVNTWVAEIDNSLGDAILAVVRASRNS